MTRSKLASRLRWLLASIVAILGLVAILRATEARLDAVSTRGAVGRKPTTWITLDGVEYRPMHEVSPPDRGSPRIHRAVVEACDPVSGRRLWKVTIHEGTSPQGVRAMLERPMSEARFLAGFALKLAVQDGKISVTTPDGAAYLVEPGARKVIPIRPASPPPALDIRLACGTRCEVHDRPLKEGVVPIRSGYSMVSRANYEARKSRFPHANSSYGGGCFLGEATEARVLYCPDCRDTEREWARKPALTNRAIAED